MEKMEGRYAWYGRVSTEDEQDPTLSFPRQLANAERRVATMAGSDRPAAAASAGNRAMGIG